MLPPIPDPVTPPLTKGPRPPSLKIILGLNTISSILGFPIYCDGTLTNISVAADIVFYGITTIIWFALMWFLWLGYNWARQIVIISCVLGSFGIFMISSQTPLQQAVTVVDTILWFVSVWWLRSPAIVAYTKGQPA